MHQTHHDALKPIRQKPDSQGTNATACVLDCRAPDTHLENTAYISGAQASDQQPRKRRSPAQHAGRQLTLQAPGRSQPSPHRHLQAQLRLSLQVSVCRRPWAHCAGHCRACCRQACSQLCAGHRQIAGEVPPPKCAEPASLRSLTGGCLQAKQWTGDRLSSWAP